MRQSVATDAVKAILNKVDAGLTTADLVNMNADVSLNHLDADVVAKNYLVKNNYFS